jgi:hypothetical protein
MFFKNLRQIYYDITDMPQLHTQVFRYSKRYQQQDRPMLYPVIVIDYGKQEAYLHMEMNDILWEEEVLLIREEVKETNRFYEYQLRERGRENMLEFATKLYEGIMDENRITIKVNGNYVPMFIIEEDAESFRVVMGDYYRLTKIF